MATIYDTYDVKTMEHQGLRPRHLNYTDSPCLYFWTDNSSPFSPSICYPSEFPAIIFFPFTLLILPSFSSAQSLCLSDEPRAVEEYRYPEQLPGELYDADTQCKWQFGEKAKLCTLDFKKVDVTRARTLMQNKQSEKPRAEWEE